ncbi:MAG: zinc ribbon domain-containing protein [Anaerolineae bacterium]|nr:MAG: zinc ribbon domain-containing protein [Anaerolineae bacterium]MCL4879761.1 zinc ribbon domain-containing protein [Anaerolineae bacterium]
MPTYEFLCNDTGQTFEVNFRTYAEYDPTAVRSPFTGSHNVTRLISTVAISTSGGHLDALLQGDEQVLDTLENADPSTLGRTLRQMALETGEDMGSEFNEIVDRLESGQSPQDIEQSLPDNLKE